MPVLYTIGYEGFSLPDWLTRLRVEGVEVVVDIRAVPHSRKPGFSKRQLKEKLGEVGVEYLHFPELGTPEDLRRAVRGGLDLSEFERQFNLFLRDKEEALIRLLELAQNHLVCLVCYEEDPASCHRSVVASHLQALASHLWAKDSATAKDSTTLEVAAASSGGELKVVHLRRM
ncbi:MAG: DUF488 domain-containing protein [Thermoleophilia bacterium]|nr:DUF488 domain-containing protein [Thermoleophilia bacterium]